MTYELLPQNVVPAMDVPDKLVDYGDQRIRAICASRSIDWDRLSEEERMRLLDEMLHQDELTKIVAFDDLHR